VEYALAAIKLRALDGRHKGSQLDRLLIALTVSPCSFHQQQASTGQQVPGVGQGIQPDESKDGTGFGRPKTLTPISQTAKSPNR
jgi:hypothetical protein